MESEVLVDQTKTVATPSDDAAVERVEKWLERLDQFVDQHGHAAVPQLFEDESGQRLGRWVKHMRWRYRSGRLEASSIAALEARPGWLWHASKQNRGTSADGSIAPSENPLAPMASLIAFANRHGHTAVPYSSREPDDSGLGDWVRRQRAHYRAGDLSSRRVALLEAVPHWSWEQTPTPSPWHETYEVLRQWVSDHGTADLSRRVVAPSGQRLGTWVQAQRQRRGRLAPERIQLLEQLPGWSWDASWKNDTFPARLAELEAHAREHGLDEPLPPQLRRWIDRRVLDYKRGLLSDERLAAFEAQEWWRWARPSRSNSAFREQQCALEYWLESER